MRYSSAAQTEQSIDGQRTVNMQYCDFNGHTVVGEYIDAGISAYKDVSNRKEFLRMISDSSKGIFDAVVVYKLDRFSRNTYDHVVYKKKLNDNGVVLLSATEPISDDKQSNLLESILQGFSQYYSEELSEKVKRGMNESAKKQNSTGGVIPFGYKIENKKLVIDDLTAPFVKYIFEEYSKGTPNVKICKYLNDNGVKTAKGNSFSKQSFQKMLRNKKYIGQYKYNGQVYGNDIPPIISEELFDKVQKIMDSKKKHSGSYTAKTKYLLSGKCYCGKCNSVMFGDTGTSRNGDKHHYYTCTNKKKKLCTLKSAPKMPLETIVKDNLLLFLSDDEIDRIAKATAKFSHDSFDKSAQINSINAQIKDLDKKLDNLNLSLAYAVNQSTLKFIDKLENERKGLYNRLNELKQEQKTGIITEEMIVAYLNVVKKGDLKDDKFLQALVSTLVEKVLVYPDHLEIIYKLKKSETHLVACSDDFTMVNQRLLCSNQNTPFVLIRINKSPYC